MWDDIVIGEGERRNSAYLVFDIEGEHSISQNDIQYWISTPEFLDMGMRIYKDTAEGKKITQYIEKGAKTKTILNYIYGLVLKHCKPKDVISKIEQVKRDSFREGVSHQKREVRKVLGL